VDKVTTSANAYELGFQSLDEEVAHRELPVNGELPGWLSGALVRNGPGAFELGGERVTHWFDGLAMLRRYGFDDGTVSYSNRFLRTDAYESATEGTGASQFGTGATGLTRVRRWVQAMGPPEATDNANVHVARFGEQYVALTEAPRRVAFDPVTLETRGEFRWTDGLSEHMATAHFSVEAGTGESIGYAAEFGRPHQYHLYRVPEGSAERTRFASVTAEGPGYVHDCAVTAEHVVLVETPLRIAILRALFPWSEGVLDLLTYDEDRDTRFLVVARDTGELVAERRTSPFFTFHHVNAFDDGGDVVIDLVEFEDAEVVEALTFDSLSEDAFAATPDGQCVRYWLPLDGGDVMRSTRYVGALELPTVPRSVRGREYRYAYAQATDRRNANGLVKIDVEQGTATEWWEQGVYVEEPRMVQRPGSTREDDGVVLAPALDVDAERSLLLAFDAETLTECARAPLPHVVPFGFHGRFFPELDR